MKFKEVDLVDGWLIEEHTSGKPTEWKMRELRDCGADLKELAKGMIELLGKCLDFGDLFRCLVRRREGGSGWL